MRLPQRSYRTFAPVLFGFQALLLVSCESSSLLAPLSPDGLTANAERNGRRAASISLSAPDSSLTPGQQVQAIATVKDQRGNSIHNATVAWSTAANDVADVSTTGLVTGGTTLGTTTISATADGLTQTMSVNSVPAAAGEDTTSAAAGDTTSASPDSATTTPLGAAVHMVSITANATTLKIGEVTQVSGVVRDING